MARPQGHEVLYLDVGRCHMQCSHSDTTISLEGRVKDNQISIYVHECHVMSE